MLNLVNRFLVFILVLLLAACGGGGGSPGTVSGSSVTVSGSTSGTPTVAGTQPGVSTVADFNMALDKLTVQNSGNDTVALTVTTLDAFNNVVSNVPVTVAVDANGVYTPTSGTTTNATGQYTGIIGTGVNKADRNINVTVSVNGISKVVTFAVVGSQITITPVPAVPKPGEQLSLNIKVTDFSNTGIPNVPVQLSGTLGFNGTPKTDASGNLVVGVTAPVAGTYTAVVSASGVSVTKVILVAAAGGVGVAPATGPVSGANLLANPATIAPNIAGASTNRSVLTAKFIRADNTTIANMRVRFEIVAPVLGAGEFISTGNALTFTDASGVATADYVAGQRASPTNGVKIRACYDLVDFAEGACPNQIVGSLTVNSQPLAISIGNFNKIETALGGIAYVQKFLIQVADSSGVAVKGAVVSMSLDITHFGKGTFSSVVGSTALGYQQTGAQPPTATSLNYSPTGAALNIGSYPTYSAFDVPSASGRVWCVNEDRNRNGFNDVGVGEDLNNNTLLEPSKSEIVLSYVSGNSTDINGQMLVQVSYPQNMATWLAYTLKATTSVVGSEGTKERAFITDFLLGDVSNGSFLSPPYGIKSCITPN